uniref:internalin N-terminal domain-containing protein n=1 Tax=Listeria monocytogenes TaxID=1639 RepID=UPI000AAAF79F
MKKLCTVILFLTLLLNGFVPNAHAKTESPSADNNLQVAPPAAIKDLFPDPAMANDYNANRKWHSNLYVVTFCLWFNWIYRLG